MENDIPLEWINLYSMYQHNVFKFFNEMDKIFAHYFEFIINLQRDWLNYWQITLNSDLPIAPNFAEKNTNYSKRSTSNKETIIQKRKFGKTGKGHEILNQSLSKLPLY